MCILVTLKRKPKGHRRHMKQSVLPIWKTSPSKGQRRRKNCTTWYGNVPLPHKWQMRNWKRQLLQYQLAVVVKSLQLSVKLLNSMDSCVYTVNLMTMKMNKRMKVICCLLWKKVRNWNTVLSLQPNVLPNAHRAIPKQVLYVNWRSWESVAHLRMRLPFPRFRIANMWKKAIKTEKNGCSMCWH